MTNAPRPTVLAGYLERLAKQLRDRGDYATEMAHHLAARGYPAGNGDGRRSSDTTSSTERAGTTEPNKWVATVDELAEDMRKLWYHATRVDSAMSRILAHATTDDQVPVGTGACYLTKLCEEFCRPTLKDPDNRLREGLGPACWQAWLRYRSANPGCTRQQFLDHRRSTLRARLVPG